MILTVCTPAGVVAWADWLGLGCTLAAWVVLECIPAVVEYTPVVWVAVEQRKCALVAVAFVASLAVAESAVVSEWEVA